MAPPPSPSGSRQKPAGPWALLWLGGSAAAAWIPLLLVDALPTPPRVAEPPSAAISAPIASARATVPIAPPQAPAASPAQLPALESRRPSAQGAALALPGIGHRAIGPSAAPGPSTPEPPLRGSLLLGGPLTLASLNEKPMVSAARIERALRAASSNRLEAVPNHWRPTMEALIQGQKQVLPAEVVRVPAPHLKQPEEYPMAVLPDGVAETSVSPSPSSRQTLERWAARQKPPAEGGVRPVIVVLEPLAADPAPESNRP